mgnify:CR=1 FL=1
MFDLSGKTAIITGSSKGIGRSVAFAMAEQGAQVVVSSRKADACKIVADEINEKYKEEKVGANVTYVSPGDTVVGCLSIFCGRCERCLEGNPALCLRDPMWGRGEKIDKRIRYVLLFLVLLW